MKQLRTIKRLLPDGTSEIIKMEDLHKGDVFTMAEDGVLIGTMWCAKADGEYDSDIDAGSVLAEEVAHD